MNCPILMIAAPASGSGKTTVTAGLARLHARAGRRVRVFKCGPDFLDPLILQRASGHAVYNLDLWMVGKDECARLLARAAREADLILVEAVMGLYDGDPSAADLAQHFGLPVVSIIDASAMAQTFGAVAHGLALYEPALEHRGVFANLVAGAGHEQMLRASVRPPSTWLGALQRDEAWALPERHLGLVAAAEIVDLDARLDRLADALASTALAALPPPVALLPAAESSAPPKWLAGKRVAVARDAAFCFLYAANLDCLRQLGAELAFFSPLAESSLPACDAVYLPGGYPELHAHELAANESMRNAMRAWVQADQPLLAECGGMMVLFDTLIDVAGHSHRMWGLLPGRVTMQPRLAAIGPQSFDLGEGPIRGHTFHHSHLATALAPVCRAVKHPGSAAGEAVYRAGNLTASYMHGYFASNPAAAARLFATRPTT
jgi:cobyrinic acid a,c-diamide synthase